MTDVLAVTFFPADADDAQTAVTDLCRALRTAREQAVLSQRQVAKAIGCSSKSISYVDNEAVTLASWGLLGRYAAAVDLTLTVSLHLTWTRSG